MATTASNAQYTPSRRAAFALARDAGVKFDKPITGGDGVTFPGEPRVIYAGGQWVNATNLRPEFRPADLLIHDLLQYVIGKLGVEIVNVS